MTIKRLFFTIIAVGLCAELVHAGYYIVHDQGVLTPNYRAYQSYTQQELQFLKHLQSCQSYQVESISPVQPSIIVSREIMGWRRNACHVMMMYRLTHSQQAKPTTLNCHFNQSDITRLTNRKARLFIKDLKNYNKVHDTSQIDTPAMAKLMHKRCVALNKNADINKTFY